MKNNKKIIGLIIILVITIIAVIAVLYFLTDLFKTEKQLFCEYISEMEIMDSNFIERFGEANKRILKNNRSSITNIELKMSSLNSQIGVENTQKIFGIESDLKRNISSKQDSCDLKFVVGDQEFLILRYLRDDNTYALKAENILAKYLAIENDNLKDLFSKVFGQQPEADTASIPDSIKINSQQLTAAKRQELMKYLKETYGTLIYNNIDEEKFYKEITSDKVTVIGVTLTNYDLINLSEIVLQTLNNDTNILNFIIDLNKEYRDTEKLTVEDIQAEIQDIIEMLEEKSSELEEKETLKISLTKKGIISKINIEIFTKQIVSYTGVDTSKPIYKDVKYDFEIDFSEVNNMVASVKENDNELQRIILNYLYNDNKFEFNIKLNSHDGKKPVGTTCTISNYNSDNITTNFIVDVLLEDTNYQLTINDITTLKDEIQIPKLTTENSAKLNDMTSEEIQKLFEALYARIIQLYGNNNSIVQTY